MLREMSLTVALLLITSGVLTNAQKAEAAAAEAEAAEVVVAEGAPLSVECSLRVEQRAEWRLDGGGVPGDMRAGEAARGARLAARLHAPAARAHHAGLYRCAPDAPPVRVRLLPAPPGPRASSPGPHEPSSAPHAPHTPHAPRTPAGGEEGFSEEEAPVVYYDINRNLSLACAVPSADKSLAYQWKKDNVPLEEVAALKERYVLEEGGALFRVKGKASEEDFGNYSCALGGAARAWSVRGRPLARLPDNTNVVEGQKLKLQCKVLGKPYPRVWWTYNGTEGADGADGSVGADGALLPAEGDARWSVEPNEQGVEGAALVLSAAARSDAGVYTCHAGERASDHTTLRVKDMYAALWPFLGICAEVFVLCAIILVYEKRRTKPELDDSDTDNHDQKKS